MVRPAENGLLAPVEQWLAATSAVETFTEVAMHGRSKADIVAVRHDGYSISVELKVKDWRRAVHQAVLNSYCTHEAYVAIWWNAISTECEELCTRYGVGLLSVEPEGCQVVLSPTTRDPLVDTASRLRLTGG